MKIRELVLWILLVIGGPACSLWLDPYIAPLHRRLIQSFHESKSIRELNTQSPTAKSK
ncbi:MAG: hypothetical protein JNJ77_03645 [Planctomycetia bacterium]|nr:hypothetical protein [Planctomycetia bacterium]